MKIVTCGDGTDGSQGWRRFHDFSSALAEHCEVTLVVPRSAPEVIREPDSEQVVSVDVSEKRPSRAIAWKSYTLAKEVDARFVVAHGLRSAWALAGNAEMQGRLIAWLPAAQLLEELRAHPKSSRALAAIGESARIILVDDEVSRLALGQTLPRMSSRVFVVQGLDGETALRANSMKAETLVRFLQARYRVLVFADGQEAGTAVDRGAERFAPFDVRFSEHGVQIIRLTVAESEGAPGPASDHVLSVVPAVADHQVSEGRLLPRYAAWHLATAAEQLDCDLVLTSDLQTSLASQTNETLADRLWPVLPFTRWEEVEEFGVQQTAAMCERYRRVLVHGVQSRAMLEARVPALAGKALVLSSDSGPDQGPAGSSGTADVIVSHMERALQTRPDRWNQKTLKVLVAGHDFKFVGELIDSLANRADVEVRYDKWKQQNLQDESASRTALQWADVILCEFASHNAVWYSWEKQPHQQLVVHFHGYELHSDWIRDINVANVDRFVFVSDFYRRQAVAELLWDEAKTLVIPNMIDTADLRRPKLPGSEFHLGIAGIVPILKRPDRALDLLELLLEHDSRYTLHVRGRNPWEYGWMWGAPEVKDAYEAFYERLHMDRHLRRHVSFDGFGPDMARWFQKIGWVLSPSTRETFHLAPVEGMASGAVPVVWSRRGAEEIFGQKWVHGDTARAAEYIAAVNADAGEQGAMRRRASSLAQRFDIVEHRDTWYRLLTEPTRAWNSVPDSMYPAERVERMFAAQPTVTRLAWLVRVLYRDGNRPRISQLAQEHSDLFAQLPNSVAGPTLMEEGLVALLESPHQIPPRSAGTVYLPAAGTALHVEPEKRDGGLPSEGTHHLRLPLPAALAHDDISLEPALSQLTVDRFVLAMADLIVRRARVERPEVLVGLEECWVAFATIIAARRLGVPCAINLSSDERERWPEAAQRLENEADYFGPLGSDDGWASTAIAANEATLRSAAPGKSLGQLRIGLIADQFTTRTIAESVNIVPLRRADGYLQVAVEHLDAVFVESAWEGPEDEWRRGVAYNPDLIGDLKRIVDVARHKGIPVVFWNKEDPVHFKNFRGTAALMDHVFTTDGDCVPQYLALPDSRIRTASAIPFFAQPAIHNPLETDRPYDHSVAYAGTYYGDRFRERSIELHGILEEAARHGLTIYDRQVNVPNSPYHFPPELTKFVREGVPYDEVLKVYKAHPVNINVNSARSSSTMFSRRVVEIAASGSVVLSGAGRGINEMLAPIPATGDAAVWREKLAHWMTDEGARVQEAWDQLRTVARSHLAEQALTLLFRTAGLAINIKGLPSYAVDLCGRSDSVSRLLSQTWKPCAVFGGGELDASTRSRLIASGIDVLPDARELPEDVEWIGTDPMPPFESFYEDLLYGHRFGLWSQVSVLHWNRNLGAGHTLARAGSGGETVLYRRVDEGQSGTPERGLTWLLPPKAEPEPGP